MGECLTLLRLGRAHWRWMLLGFALALITLLANVALLGVSGWFLAAMAVAGASASQMNYFTPAGVIRFLALGRTAGRYGERLLTHDATLRLLSALRQGFFSALSTLEAARWQRQRSGDLYQRLQSDIETLEHFYLRLLLPLALALVGVPCVLWALAHWSPTISLISATGLLAVGVLLPIDSLRHSHPLAKRNSQLSQRLRERSLESVHGLAELSLYRQSPAHAQATEQTSQALGQSKIQQERIAANHMAASQWLTQMTLWAGLWCLIPALANEQISAPIGALLMMLSLVGFETVAALPGAFERWPLTLAAAKRVFAFANPNAAPGPTEASAPARSPTEHSLRFRRVCLRYGADAPWALESFDLSIAEGERVALLGPSGAGKSSLVNLLAGFWPAQAGEVLWGDIDLEAISPEQRRQQLSVMPQQPYLLAASVAENLRLADPQASEQALHAACERVGLHDFICTLPEGYDTLLGESGYGVSGGQARRLSLAQALLKRAPVWLLDEPTEGLDPINERQICEQLLPLMCGKTVLLITHRPILLEAVDRVVVMHAGRVAYQGRHAELLRTEPSYRQWLRLS